MAHHALPPAPHPTASAFFAAHDDATAGVAASHYARSSGLASVRNSLGWRTRHSSSESYPVSILPVEGRRRGRWGSGDDGEGGGAAGEPTASFRVRQVFPRSSGRGDAEYSNDRTRAERGIGGGDVVDDVDDVRKPPSSAGEGDCELGTGATVWPGSLVLVRYLERLAHDPDRPNVLEGRTVVDLGSGTAIASIASALLGASVVVCTDGCDPVVDLARRNIRDAVSLLDPRGGAGGGGSSSPTFVGSADSDLAEVPTDRPCDLRGCKIIARRYRWGEGMPLGAIAGCMGDDHESARDHQDAAPGSENGEYFDVILGSDCIIPRLYPIRPLVDAIDELAGNGTVTYLAYEQRHHAEFDPAAEFRRLAATRGLGVEVVPDGELHPMYPAADIQIWRILRRGDDGGRRPQDGAGGFAEGTGMDGPRRVGGGRSDHQSLLVGKSS